MDVEERRRAADALRAIKRGGEGWYSLSESVIGKPAPRDEVVAKLADLIDPGEDVSVSVYDLLPEEDREALRWVNEHGGLENVSDAWDEAVNLCATIGCEPNDASEMMQALGECTDVADRRLMPPGFEWTDAFEDAVDFMESTHDLLYTIDGDEHTSEEMIAEIMKRLMPVGIEWPRCESGKPVRFGDEYIDHGGLLRKVERIILMGDGYLLASKTGAYYLRRYGQRVKRPAVLAADGEPLEVGQTVWHTKTGAEYRVLSLPDGEKGAWLEDSSGKYFLDHAVLTHQRPVLGADGLPIHEGDTVYGAVFGGPFTVTEVSDKGSVFVDAFPDTGMHGSMLTHAKPELPDSWERLEEDAKLAPGDYIEKQGRKTDLYAYEEMPIDLVRRCKAMAERSE